MEKCDPEHEKQCSQDEKPVNIILDKEFSKGPGASECNSVENVKISNIRKEDTDSTNSIVCDVRVIDLNGGGNVVLHEMLEIQATADYEDTSLKTTPSPGREGKQLKMLYEIEDVPLWYLTLFLGFQHYLLVAGSTFSLPLILMPAMCMQVNDPDMGNIISTLLLTSGIVTLLQTTFGTRLPIVQGTSVAYLIPALAILSTERWKCPIPESNDPEDWKKRMREIQGSIMVASTMQIALGFFGIFGYIMKYITPITLASAVIIIGLSLFEVASNLSASSWPISLSTMTLVIIFSQYFRNVTIPILLTKSKKRKGMLRYPIFQIFPVLLAIIIVWGICALLTVFGALPEAHPGRTDLKLQIVRSARWFRVPYPFQWGFPTFSAGAVIGFLSAVFAGIVESLGEYQAVARISKAPKPPIHTINRGVFMEGIGCFITGMFGTGNGTTSHSENTGAMSITRVGSRRVVQTAGVLLIIFSVIGKLGAFFSAIPEPIIGGVLCVTFAMIIAVGISNLQNVDLTSSRNIFIVGFSIFFSLSISKWVAKNKNYIDVGNSELNFTIEILLNTGMFIAAVTSCFLDNTIPGTADERGFRPKTEITEEEDVVLDESIRITYDLPLGMKILRRYEITSWFPISPTFKPSHYSHIFRRKTPK